MDVSVCSRIKKSTNESGFGGWLLAKLKLRISNIFKVALSWRFNWNLPTHPPSKFQWKLGHKENKKVCQALIQHLGHPNYILKILNIK